MTGWCLYKRKEKETGTREGAQEKSLAVMKETSPFHHGRTQHEGATCGPESEPSCSQSPSIQTLPEETDIHESESKFIKTVRSYIQKTASETSTSSSHQILLSEVAGRYSWAKGKEEPFHVDAVTFTFLQEEEGRGNQNFYARQVASFNFRSGRLKSVYPTNKIHMRCLAAGVPDLIQHHRSHGITGEKSLEMALSEEKRD
ncbi:PREDICTED: uncharacterized protein LOC102022332 [Chinchilla lanigera]|uniref:uncharacterized protein LOC102022332 n=1 Tax=Chinchilla lanigera TaxID=34839 RepID=UPI00038ED369|nr:PREDICTED: uncharacterized protein LOC102022332 [Chinchilla lanigera]XP_013373094.1 PREDICTED: uncharacterized protein LOC102022332 [Chinchilla lanigera]